MPGVNPTVGEAHPRPQTGTQAPLPLRWSRETASSEGARDLKEHKGDFISWYIIIAKADVLKEIQKQLGKKLQIILILSK